MSRPPPSDGGDGGILGSLGAVIAILTRLMRNEVALVRAEAGRSVDQARRALVQVAVAAVLAMVGLNVLAGALVAWLAGLGLSPAVAALIVGGGLLALAFGYIQAARSRMRPANLWRGRSRDSLRRDAETLSDAARSKPDE